MPERSDYRPTERFTSKAETYAMYRPGYPNSVLDELEARGVLRNDYVIADIGSGTGLLSENFIRRGHRVYGVEPNGPMRAMAERRFCGCERFVSMSTRAEDTGLTDSSIDLIVVGQAFHWFELEPTRREFERILKKGRSVAIVWNERQDSSEGFLADYDRLLDRHCDRSGPMGRMNVDKETIAGFFYPGPMERFTVPNWQEMELEGAMGRLTSSSYAPDPGQSGYDEIMAELTEIFERHQKGGKVRFDYDTEVYLGRFVA